MAEKKKFLLRIDENVYTALEKWASDDLRSINAQIEFLLKDSLKRANRPVTPPGINSKSVKLGNEENIP